MKLLVCYELELEQLVQSLEFLKQALELEDLFCMHLNDLEKSDLDFSAYKLYSFHLGLENEIEKHEKISSWAKANSVTELNPCLGSKNIFDDKFSFVKFLEAAAFQDLKTKLYKNSSDLESFSDKLILKPRHGTEKIDVYLVEQNSELIPEAIKKIQAYDDVLLQEFIEIKQEYKILYCLGELYSNLEILEPKLLAKLDSFLTQLGQYLDRTNQVKAEIFSLDLLEDHEGNYYILELNLRPGALYRFKHQCPVMA